MRSSFAPEGNIAIFERLYCSLTNIIHSNWQRVKWIGKIEICSIWANVFKTRSMPPSENEQKAPILAIFCAVTPKQEWWPPNCFRLLHWQVNDLKYLKKLQISINRNLKYNWKRFYWHKKDIAFYVQNHCPKFKKKVAMKAFRDILTASYLIALLDISNENTDYLFDWISRFIKYFETRTNTCYVALWGVRLICYSSQTSSGNSLFIMNIMTNIVHFLL